MINLGKLPYMVMADANGRVFEHPRLRMMGASGRCHIEPVEDDLIPLPPGADLHLLPGRHPVGIDPGNGQREVVRTFRGGPVFAVSAFLPPAYTALLWAAFIRDVNAPILPLYAYGALGWTADGFVAAAVRVDPDSRQDLSNFPDDASENEGARLAMRENPGNRLISHLAHCCTVYRCPAARNLFLGRYEAPLPTSQACNARCIGCISLQMDGRVPATQDRIRFTPTAEEIAQVAVFHIEKAERPVVSFGQGCEGEPLTCPELLEEAIRLIRRRTAAGTINLNTNASRPEAVSRLIEAGLSSIRVSLNSARKDLYERYFRPVDYTFENVVESMKLGVDMGCFVSVNYFVFPGLTDETDESAALEDLRGKTGFHMIQWRNLNIDPDHYMDSLSWEGGRAIGMRALMDRTLKRLPDLRFGYFNPYLGACALPAF